MKKIKSYIIGWLGISFLTLLFFFLETHVNQITVSLAFLLFILFVATIWGSKPAIMTSIFAVFCFNFFFLPPIGTLTIYDPQNWIALLAFLIVSLTAGQLSANSKKRAEEAENLYQQLQIAFEQASDTEAIRRSEKLKSSLLDAVTHDLRTPLTSIKASITTLLESENNKDFKLDAENKLEFLSVINEETDRLNQFIEEMVELARIEAGELKLQQTWCEANEIVENALRRLESFLSEFHVTISFEKDLPLLRADSKMLAEVLYNLLENAAKYSTKQSTIEISAKLYEKDSIEFSVLDQGRGISLDLRRKVFDKFYRVKIENEHTPSGTGLGLAIAKGIVEAHGGRIFVSDGLNNCGTKFTFLIPIGDE